MLARGAGGGERPESQNGPRDPLGHEREAQDRVFQKTMFSLRNSQVFDGPGEPEGVPGELVRRPGGVRERSLERSGHPESA